MPDLSNLLPSLPSFQTDQGSCDVLPKERRGRGRRPAAGKSLEEHVQAWVKRKVDSGVNEKDCMLPFLNGSLKMVQCWLCKKFVNQGDEVLCSIDECRHAYHRSCVKLKKGSSKAFKCSKHKEAFRRLPVPYVEENYDIGSIVNEVLGNNTEPAPYIHIRRNIYLVKRKRECSGTEAGCKNCNSNSDCSQNCECRGLSLSCTKFCHCSEMCTNRPFRKEKKIKVVKTNFCGWGAVALESVEKGDFVVEYVGEVIDDALCEQRLWDMKRRGDQNFYMCEIRKDFTIDATFKGNFSRFLNHSCDPNCKLEKWQVDGETRVGVFALQSIQTGESLTYDYSSAGHVRALPSIICKQLWTPTSTK